MWTKFTTPPKSNNRGKWKNKEEVEKKNMNERKDKTRTTIELEGTLTPC